MVISMNKKIIIVAGYVATGKTTFSLKLSQALGIPYFSRDLLKIALSRSIPVNSRDASNQLSAATFDALEFITEKFMETGFPLIIESNFVIGENHNKIKEGDTLKTLTKRYDYQTLTYIFLGDLRILYKRFIERDKLPTRGQANQMWDEINFEDFKKGISPLGDFTIGGEIVKIDTTDFGTVDFESHIETARLFMNSI